MSTLQVEKHNTWTPQPKELLSSVQHLRLGQRCTRTDSLGCHNTRKGVNDAVTTDDQGCKVLEVDMKPCMAGTDMARGVPVVKVLDDDDGRRAHGCVRVFERELESFEDSEEAAVERMWNVSVRRIQEMTGHERHPTGAYRGTER